MKKLTIFILLTFIFSSCDVPQRNRFIQTPAFNSGTIDNENNNQNGNTNFNNAGTTQTNSTGTQSLAPSEPTSQGLYNCTSSMCIRALGNFGYERDRFDPLRFRFAVYNQPLNLGNVQGICFAPFHIDQSNRYFLMGQIECTNYIANQVYVNRYSLYSNFPVNAIAIFHAAALNAFQSALNNNSSSFWTNFEQQHLDYFRMYGF